MENNLDKYFKDNLHDRSFEMKEEYWLGAENLLVEQDRRRKRRVLFWWFNGGLAILALVLGWWLLSEKRTMQPIQPTSNIAEQAPPASEVVTSPSSAVKVLPGSEERSVQSHTSNNPTIQQSSNSTIQSTANQPVAPNKTRSLSSIKSHNNKPTTSSVTKNGAVKSENTILLNPKTDEGDAAKKTLQKTVSGELDALQPEQFDRVNALEKLALLTPYVTGNFEKKDLATVTKTVKIEVAKQRRFHLGLLASQMLLARPDSGEQTRIGFRAGLVLRCDIRDNWYISSGLQYQRRTGHFDASKAATAKRFSFGVELDTLVLRPNGLHYLTMPILLGWEHDRHQFEGGILLDYLTGVHGQSGSYRYAGEPLKLQFVADKSGWTTKDGYRIFTPTMHFGYRYNIVGKWSLGLTANYTLGGILDTAFEPPLGGFLLRESDKFHLGLQAVYFIN